ncbi:MAG TPA: hypothetical protein VJ508_06010, partial [Saprospiraceae bacterium]|nr:hypothetical protein [Saprospiraceae bacterium]
MQHHAEETAVNRQSVPIAVIDKAQLPEFVYEMTDPGPGGADHLGQVAMADFRKYPFGSAFLAKMSQQQEDARETLFARIKKLAHEIRLVSDVAHEQMCDEQLRNLVPLPKQALHQRLLDPNKITDC